MALETSEMKEVLHTIEIRATITYVNQATLR